MAIGVRTRGTVIVYGTPTRLQYPRNPRNTPNHRKTDLSCFSGVRAGNMFLGNQRVRRGVVDVCDDGCGGVSGPSRDEGRSHDRPPRRVPRRETAPSRLGRGGLQASGAGRSKRPALPYAGASRRGASANQRLNNSLPHVTCLALIYKSNTSHGKPPALRSAERARSGLVHFPVCARRHALLRKRRPPSASGALCGGRMRGGVAGGRVGWAVLALAPASLIMVRWSNVRASRSVETPRPAAQSRFARERFASVSPSWARLPVGLWIAGVSASLFLPARRAGAVAWVARGLNRVQGQWIELAREISRSIRPAPAGAAAAKRSPHDAGHLGAGATQGDSAAIGARLAGRPCARGHLPRAGAHPPLRLCGVQMAAEILRSVYCSTDGVDRVPASPGQTASVRVTTPC